MDGRLRLSSERATAAVPKVKVVGVRRHSAHHSNSSQCSRPCSGCRRSPAHGTESSDSLSLHLSPAHSSDASLCVKCQHSGTVAWPSTFCIVSQLSSTTMTSEQQLKDGTPHDSLYKATFCCCITHHSAPKGLNHNLPPLMPRVLSV